MRFLVEGPNSLIFERADDSAFIFGAGSVEDGARSEGQGQETGEGK